MSQLGKEWQAKSAEEKSPFEKLSEEGKEAYAIELKVAGPPWLWVE